MNAKVMALARVHPLWQLRPRLLVGLVFAGTVPQGPMFFSLKEWMPHKAPGLAGLYCLLGVLACLMVTLVEHQGRRYRISDVERSLPVGDQDWLRAGLINHLRAPALLFAGALLAHVLVAVFSVLPVSTLAIGFATLGCAVWGISIRFVMLRDHNRTGAWRIFFATLPWVFLLGVPLLSLPVGLAMACAAPVAVVVAWKLSPTSVRESVQPATGNTESEVVASPASKSPAAVSAVRAMWSQLALRNLGWWLEVVFAPVMWIAFFVPLFARSFPFFTVGLGWCALVILTIRPTPGDERVLSSLRHLPFPRRKLFPIVGIKAVVMPAIALLAVAIAASWTLSKDRATRFTWDAESVGESAAAAPRDVMIPGEHWRIAFDDAPIEVKPRDGVSFFVQPRFAYPGLYVWHPYQLPENCSVAIAGEQVSRALQDIHGMSITPAELEEQIVAKPNGVGSAPGRTQVFSEPRSERIGTLDRIADAPLLFLPLLCILALAVMARLRVRQLPAPKLLGGVLLGRAALAVAVAVALHWIIDLGPAGNLQILLRVVLASMRSWLIVPAWMLFGICVLGTWILWHICARRFDRMEAPPVLALPART